MNNHNYNHNSHYNHNDNQNYNYTYNTYMIKNDLYNQLKYYPGNTHICRPYVV